MGLDDRQLRLWLTSHSPDDSSNLDFSESEDPVWLGAGGALSLVAPALHLISCSQGPNCRHFPSEVSGRFQKQFQEKMQLLLASLLFFSQG